MNRKSVRRLVVCFCAGLLVLGIVCPRVSAQANGVQFSFVLSTAPEAAFGAPFGYYLRATNTSTTTQTIKTTVTLTPPGGSAITITSNINTVAAGALAEQMKLVTSSRFSPATGAFTLTGNLYVPSTGPLVATVSYPINILPVPTANPNPLVYVSIGGSQDTGLLGAPFYYNTVTSNLSPSALSIRTQVTLVNPDATKVLLSKGNLGSLAANSSRVTNSATSPSVVGASANTTQYTNQTGNFSLLVQVYDSSNNLLASNTHSFTRTPGGALAPSFTDTASMGTSTSGINVDRMMMHMPGCGNFADFMPGGSGSAVADIDGDGYDDLFVADMMGMIHLYHNNQNGTFTDQTANSGIKPMPMMGMMMAGPSGASFADIDNDGRPDLLITYGPDGMLQLFHNNGFNAALGQVTFTDITELSGLSPMGATPQNFMGSTWGDYDSDGYLDLFVPVHADCMGMNAYSHLYHNNGNLTFTDTTSLLGGFTAPAVKGRSLAALFADYRQVGLVDLYVGNDIGYSPSSHPNVYWLNNGNGTFTDNSSQSKLNIAISDMGIAIGDFNRTGLLSIYNSNEGPNILLAPQPDGTYRNASGAYDYHADRSTIPVMTGGTANTRNWTVGAYDFNNDGWPDLYGAGDLVPSCIKCSSNNSNALLINNQDGTFLDETATSGLFPAMVMNNSMPSAAFADFNNDGFMDIFQAGMMGPAQLFMNNGKNTGTQNWLEVKLVGQGCQFANCGYMNKDAVGGRVVATVGGINLLRQVVNGGYYQSGSSLVLHFGLGSAAQVDTLNVYWSDAHKSVTTMTNVQANQKITITEPL